MPCVCYILFYKHSKIAFVFKLEKEMLGTQGRIEELSSFNSCYLYNKEEKEDKYTVNRECFRVKQVRDNNPQVCSVGVVP